MSGRKKDPIWYYFIEEKTTTGKGVKAKCKACDLLMMGLVSRMKKHKEICTVQEQIQIDSIEDEAGINVHNSADPLLEPGSTEMINRGINQVVSTEDKKRKMEPNAEENNKKRSMTMNSYVIKTSSSQKNAFDLQVAKFVYATNSSFQSVEHVEFKKMVSMLHPGYVPPSRFDVAGKLLDNVYTEEREKCSKILEGQVVCMSLDGWSNVSNEPIICASVTASSGEIFLVESRDTSGFSHNIEYLTELAKEVVLNCERNFNCSVRSFVTDNAKEC